MGEVLASLEGGVDLVLAIPAGGVPVAIEVARVLGVKLDVAVVSKVKLPYDTEAGYGAVAFDGTVRLDRALAKRAGLSENSINLDVERAARKVHRREARMRGARPWPALYGQRIAIVDDGVASGFTMLVAIEALRKRDPERLIVAVPTAPEDTARRLAAQADAVVCPNIRTGSPFAVADAFQRWHDVHEDVAVRLMDEWFR